jgi:hypothetical protein
MATLVAVAFALTLASSAQAMSLAPLQQANETIITVREACGAGMHGKWCLRKNSRRRAASRYARGVTC